MKKVKNRIAKNFNPKVSIIIPVYNGSNYLKQAIDSALAQTYKNIEVIVINDGSNDNNATEKIAKSYGNKIKYFKKENGGVATALNLGIDKMTGEYFSWLSHDDMYEDFKIKKQIDVILRKKIKDLIVACNVKILSDDGSTEEFSIDKKLFKYLDVFLSLDGTVGLNGCSLLIPREALLDSHGFNTSLPVTQDYDLWFRLSKKYTFILLEENLVISRRHGLQDSVIKQKICFYDSDKLHYDFLNGITYKRFYDCVEDNGIEKIFDQYNVYKNAGYIKTTSMIFKHIENNIHTLNVDRFNEFFNSEIGEIISSSFVDKEKNKKRILFFSNVWNKGGIERVLSHIFNNLGEKYDIFLVTLNDGVDQNQGYEISNNISHIKINGSNQFQELMNIMSFFEIDIFVGNPNFRESFLGIYSLLKDTLVKSVAYNHGYYFLPYMYDYLYPAALKINDSYAYADAVIWLSQIGCNIYNIENSNGLYLPDPAVLSNKKLPIKQINKNLLAVGRFDDEIKRIDRILMVFKEVLKIDANYHLDVVGSCPLYFGLREQGGKSIEEFIKELDIPNGSITFWGEQQDMDRFYDDANFLIMTSTCEGFAMVLIEALSHGTPCACFEYLGIEEVIQDGINGRLSTQDDCVGLAKKITTTINNEEEYIKMSSNAPGSISQYDVNIFLKKWEYLVESIVDIRDGSYPRDLKSSNQLSDKDYRRVISEYSRCLDTAMEKNIKKDLLIKESSLAISTPSQACTKRIDRLKASIKIDGIPKTFKKILKKVHNKYLGVKFNI